MNEEDLKNMSPEEIDKVMRENCLFCKIVKGEIPSVKLYEDNSFIAILDIRPANPGHVLVMPKEHLISLEQVDNSLFDVVKSVMIGQKQGLNAQGVSVYVAEGGIAGQRVPHAVVHVVPRVEGDGLFGWNGKELKEKQLKEIGEKIAKNLGKVQKSAPIQRVEEVVEEEGPEVIEDYKEEDRIP